MIEPLRKVIKRMHDPLEVMLTCVRWYVAYPLSLRHIEEMMQERGVFVDHATVHRWAIKIRFCRNRPVKLKRSCGSAATQTARGAVELSFADHVHRLDAGNEDARATK